MSCCKWCGQPIPVVIDGKRSTARLWHPSCLREFELHAKLPEQFDFVAERDGERCAWPDCGITPMRWLAQPIVQITRQSCFGWDRGADWPNVYWDRPAGRWSEMPPEERATGEHQSIERVTALELDHRVPLWSVTALLWDERRFYFGPGNLWLLCSRHHKAKTRAEAGQRAAIRREAEAARVRDKAGQLLFEMECRR